MKYRTESYCVIEDKTGDIIARCDSVGDAGMLCAALNGVFFREYKDNRESRVNANFKLQYGIK